ncbi:MAG: hypothetical protein ACI9JN_001294 [Bacteroidia bacterium]|jgi:hypothetical protein
MKHNFTDADGSDKESSLEEGSKVAVTEITAESTLYFSITFNGVTEEYELSLEGGPLLRPRVPR